MIGKISNVGKTVGAIFGALVLVALGGGVAYYFIIYKNKQIEPVEDKNEIATDAV